MKKHVLFVSMFFMAMFSFLALAQDAVIMPVPTEPIPSAEFFSALIASIGGFKGASALGIAYIVVQLVMKFFSTAMGSFAGKWRLVIVTGLSIVCGVLSLKVAGVSWSAALMHSQVLAALSVYLNQLWKQFVEKKD